MNWPNKPVIIKCGYHHIYYDIEPTLFKRMLINLISNAQKYADNCTINIYYDEDDKLKITVEDNGKGVPEKQLKELGNPFFRADTSRSRKTGGTGLGLAIVKQISQIHGFLVHFKNKSTGGLRITLSEI